MKRIGILLVLFVFGFAFLASAEQKSLGEIAKQEKERREALEKSGKKSKVLTNEDVGKIKSQLGMVSGSTEGEEGQPAEEDSSYTPPVEGEDYVPDQQPEQQPVDPDSEHKKQIEELENQKDEAQKKADDARATVGAGGLWHSHATGNQYGIATEAEKKAEELDQRIDKANSGQQQAQQPQQPAPPPEEYVPPPDETTEEPPVEEPPAEEPPSF
ncbi:hypothetical protein L0152_10810 [bacterium]|nr:hypothetical protein [bacterium]